MKIAVERNEGGKVGAPSLTLEQIKQENHCY
uniref:Uncharacterized protein n=1 Tax=Arundo donax TaxID=35708 RepID=A0A0A9GTJ0_ARUDO